jgi:subtilase family serine protease
VLSTRGDERRRVFSSSKEFRVKRKLMFAGLAAGALVASALAAGTTGASASPSQDKIGTHATRVCAVPTKMGQMACDSMVLVDARGKMITSDVPIPAAFTPADIQKAYNLKGLKSDGATVAVIDAYGYSNLEADLKVFRSTYGLPPCTIKNGCLSIVNQHGRPHLPPDDAGWDLEQALDVDAVSSACPDCHILVVQSRRPTGGSLGRAVNTAAATKGVVAISNSYGGGDRTNREYYDHQDVAITASTGDSGYQGGQFPASATGVIAVGGTSIVPDGSARGFNETVWSGAGSGCSKRNPMPKYQEGVKTSCKTDASSDVSAAANPGAGGLSVYYNGHFQQVGGTSESSPLIAAVFALSGKTDGLPGRYLYANPKELYDITSGSNGSCGPPLCDAGKGWDGPTGLGTPNGVGAF